MATAAPHPPNCFATLLRLPAERVQHVLRHEPPLKEPLAAYAAREVKSAAAVGNSAALRVNLDVLAVLGGETVCNTPAEFGAFLDADIARWKDVAARGGIRIQQQ